MSKPPDPSPNAYRERIQIFDLLTGVFLPGVIVAAIPHLQPKLRAAAFVVAVLLTIPAILWGTSIANAHDVRNAWARFLIHTYAMCCVASFLGLLTLPLILIKIVPSMPWPGLLLIELACAAVVGSVYPVESRRVAAAKLKEFSRAPKS